MMLYQVTLMLGSQVGTPRNGELKLVSILHCLFKDTNTLGVRQTNEIFLQHTLQAFNQSLVYHIVEELQIIHTVIQRPLHTILDEVFLQVHQIIEVDESNLWLYHPELCQMARSIGILGTECRTKSIDSTQGCSSGLTLQLTTHRQ